MEVDKKTMLITDHSDLDKDLLFKELDDMIFNGKISPYVRGVFEDWRKKCDLDDRQGLLVMSTVFPLRVYMSYHLQEEQKKNG